jgi:hypothetical protein
VQEAVENALRGKLGKAGPRAALVAAIAAAVALSAPAVTHAGPKRAPLGERGKAAPTVTRPAASWWEVFGRTPAKHHPLRSSSLRGLGGHAARNARGGA